MRARIINIISHAAGWILFFSLIIGFMSNNENNNTLSWILSAPFLIFGVTFLLLFYLNYFILIPQLYLKKQYLLYFTAIILMFSAVVLIKPFDRLMSRKPPPENLMMMDPSQDTGFDEKPPAPHKGGPGGKDINSIILFITMWSLSTAIPVIRQWRLTEKRALEAEADRANAELSFLKSQINPHFLFNTLNNIYSMAVTKNENTAPSILKLSNILRYVTDEVYENFVPLDSELECMKDYIDLQRMRLGQKMHIDLGISGNTHEKKIAPLIFMTFVENVFKYGTSSHEESQITIKVKVDEINITFYSRNKLFEARRNTERTGIGIPNARQRLKHLYPNKHFLDIDDTDGYFTVQLTVQA